MKKIVTVSNYIHERKVLVEKYLPEIANSSRVKGLDITPDAFMVKILYELDKRLEVLEKKMDEQQTS